MRGHYPLLFGLGLVAWGAVVFFVIEGAKLVSLW
jgi:hypothetical protein